MRLSSDLLYDNLSSKMKIDSFGMKIQKLILTRPSFNVGGLFAANSISIAHYKQLKNAPKFEKNCLVISVGGMPPDEYLTGRCACFVLEEQDDILPVFNEVQQIFNKYDDWQYQLQKNVDTKADLQEIVDNAFSIFRNPIIIINGDFHLHAHSSIIDLMDELADYRADSNGNLKKEILIHHLETEEKLELNKKEPFWVMDTLRGVKHLCRNLFVQDVYVGNITIPFILNPVRDSDFELFRYFSREIERAVSSHATLLNKNMSLLSSILTSLLKQHPLNSMERVYLRDIKKSGERYVCLVLQMGSRSDKSVPFKYLCNVFENTFPYSVALQHNNSVVVLVDIVKFDISQEYLPDTLRDFLVEMNLTAAISCSFSDLSLFRNFYRQACLAMEYAQITGDGGIYHRFETYKLLYMTTHCFGEFSFEIMKTPGLVKLIESDETNETSYIKTLRIYLRNNMNITRTAQELYIHRSTFLERIKKIEKILGMDLKSSDTRLYLLIMLKAIDVMDMIADSRNSLEDSEEEE